MYNKQYYLMNKNSIVLVVTKDNESKAFCSIDEVRDIEYAPFYVYQAYKSNTLLRALNFWFSNRSIPNYRDNKDSIIEKFNLSNIDDLVDKDYALSLSDQYWLKPIDEDVRWDDVNYFRCHYESKEFFNATYGEGGFQTMNIKEISSDMFKYPNNTLGGQLKKFGLRSMEKIICSKGREVYITLNRLTKFLHLGFVKYLKFRMFRIP